MAGSKAYCLQIERSLSMLNKCDYIGAWGFEILIQHLPYLLPQTSDRKPPRGRAPEVHQAKDSSKVGCLDDREAKLVTKVGGQHIVDGQLHAHTHTVN